jgi:predicted nuclease of predicted toxin-antitoxin system
MKLLLDENLSSKLCRPLDGIFPGSSQVVLVGLAQANDRDIWDYAAANGFTVVSLDADFAERAIFIGPPPKVIWQRCGNQPTDAVEELLRRHTEVILAFENDPAACLEIY